MLSFYLVPLLLTLVIEITVATLFCREKKFLLLVVVANILTNPLANFLVKTFPIIWYYPLGVPLLEVAIVLVEFGFYSAFYRKRYAFLFLFSLCSNACSYLTGVFLQMLGLL